MNLARLSRREGWGGVLGEGGGGVGTQLGLCRGWCGGLKGGGVGNPVPAKWLIPLIPQISNVKS